MPMMNIVSTLYVAVRLYARHAYMHTDSYVFPRSSKEEVMYEYKVSVTS
jgi:hypothetical protein